MNTQPNTYLNQQRDLEHDHMTPLVLFFLSFFLFFSLLHTSLVARNYRCVGSLVACTTGVLDERGV